MKICTSCNKVTTDFVSFPCPICGEEIVRCKVCRGRSNTYTCSKCGFEGP